MSNALRGIYWTTGRKYMWGTGSRPTVDNVGIYVKGVIDGVNGSPPVVPLAEGKRTSVFTDAQNICVPSQRNLR